MTHFASLRLTSAGQHLHPAPLRVAHERRGRVEAHRLLVQERAQELRGVVPAQPLRLVGEEPERSSVRLREAEPGEADELVEDAVRGLRVDVVPLGALDEPPAVRLERVMAPLAAHRAAQPLCVSDREAGERHSHLEHLVLEDDDAVGRAKRLAQELVIDRPDIGRVLPQPLPGVDVGMHRLPLDRPRPDERDLDGEVVEVRRLRPQKALHLRSALDLERADRVRALDLREHLGIVERDA